MSAPPATSSSSSGSHPSVTESKGKLCSACSAQLSKSSFSNKQWLEPAAQRRCINCIAANTPSKAAAAASSPAPSTASATPTPTTSLPPPPATSSAVPLKAKKASAAPVIRPSPVRENSVLSNKPHSARPVKKNPKRPTLLDDEGDWFLPGPEAALSEIFDRFDVDHDEQWSIKETQSFAVATNGKAFTTEYETHARTQSALTRSHLAGELVETLTAVC